MSTAVMPHSAVYDFGDILFKSAPGGNARGHGGGGAGDSLSAPFHQLTVGGIGSLGGGGLGVGLGSATTTLSPRQLHNALSRVSSVPAAALVSSLLDNLSHRRLERTQSAPVSAAAVQAAAVNTSRYKTELCRPFEESGSCKYGDKCQFAHGVAELRSLARHPKYKTELCRTYHTVGFCPYGPRCHFVHNQEEARQHNRAVAALLAARVPRPRPPALSPSSLSLGSADSPNSSLSQSPTSSLGSFFSSESELLSPPAVSPISHHSGSPSPPPLPLSMPLPLQLQQQQSQSPQQPPVEGENRLPVFNRLSAIPLPGLL